MARTKSDFWCWRINSEVNFSDGGTKNSRYLDGSRSKRDVIGWESGGGWKSSECNSKVVRAQILLYSWGDNGAWEDVQVDLIVSFEVILLMCESSFCVGTRVSM